MTEFNSKSRTTVLLIWYCLEKVRFYFGMKIEIHWKKSRFILENTFLPDIREIDPVSRSENLLSPSSAQRGSISGSQGRLRLSMRRSINSIRSWAGRESTSCSIFLDIDDIFLSDICILDTFSLLSIEIMLGTSLIIYPRGQSYFRNIQYFSRVFFLTEYK